MGFSLQRSDRILSRTPLGSPCPSFPWLARVRLAGVETTAFRDTCRFAHRLRQEIVRPRIDACRVLLSQGIGKRTRQGSSACCGLTSSASLPGSTGRRSAGGPEGRCLAKPRTMGRCRLVRCRAAARGTVKCPIAARSGCASSSRTSLACCAGRTIPRRILRFRRAGDTKNEAHLEAPVRRRPGRFRLRVLVPPRVSSPRSLRPVRLTSHARSGFSNGSAVSATRPAQDLRLGLPRGGLGSICVRSGVAPPPRSTSDFRALPRGGSDMLESKGFSPGPARFAGRFSGRWPLDAPLLGFPPSRD